MRLDQTTDGRSHAGLTLTVNDHHSRPLRVSFSNTSQVIAAGADYVLDVALGRSDFQLARMQLLGAAACGGGSSTWKECASVHATRDAADAVGHSTRSAGSNYKVYSVSYAKAAGATLLTHKIFDSVTTTGNEYIALREAVLTGSVLRLTFTNYDASSRTLWVKGEALVW